MLIFLYICAFGAVAYFFGGNIISFLYTRPWYQVVVEKLFDADEDLFDIVLLAVIFILGLIIISNLKSKRGRTVFGLLSVYIGIVWAVLHFWAQNICLFLIKQKWSRYVIKNWFNADIYIFFMAFFALLIVIGFFVILRIAKKISSKSVKKKSTVPKNIQSANNYSAHSTPSSPSKPSAPSSSYSSSRNFDEQEAANKAAEMGKNATEADIQNVQRNMGKMKKSPLAKIWNKVVALWDAFRSPSTPAWLKGTIIGALIYMVSPIDLVPDVIPVFGLLDDASVIGFAFSQLVRLGIAGAVGAGVATVIKVARLSVNELKKQAKQIDSRAMSAKIEECIKKNDVNYVKAGLLDADGTEINTMEIEAGTVAPDIKEGAVISLAS